MTMYLGPLKLPRWHWLRGVVPFALGAALWCRQYDAFPLNTASEKLGYFFKEICLAFRKLR